MAKVLFGGGVAQIRGSEAGTTYSRNKGGSYIRNRVTPINPLTPDQIAARDRISLLSKRWANTLTDLQRQSWEQFGDSFPVQDSLGQTIILSGIQSYVKLNARLLAASNVAVILDDAPANQDVQQIITASVVFDSTAIPPEAVLTFSPADVAFSFLQIRSTPQLSPGITFVKNRLRLIANIDKAPSPQDFTTDWTDKFGVFPAPGTRVVTTTRQLNTTNAAVGVELRSDSIVI